jgi:hypothetical protein
MKWGGGGIRVEEFDLPWRRGGRREKLKRVGDVADIVASWGAASSAPTARLARAADQWEVAGTTAAAGNAVVWSRTMRQPSGNFLKSREKTPEGWSASRTKWNFPTT